MLVKSKGETVFQMFELNPSVDKKDSLKILIKTGLAEQSGFKQACKDGGHRFMAGGIHRNRYSKNNGNNPFLIKRS